MFPYAPLQISHKIGFYLLAVDAMAVAKRDNDWSNNKSQKVRSLLVT